MAERAETAILAGGCSWIMQQLLRHPDGVISTRVGWTGGKGENPSDGDPQGHAEAVEVIFDPARLSYRELLEYFFQIHRADLGEDLVGSVYRSGIFFTSEAQRRVAEETIADVDASGHWPGKTATQITKAGRFWEDPAEDQDHFLHFPDYPEGSKPPFPRTRAKASRAKTPLEPA
jgi:peptide-methionine (S)-S-oxide reductase